MKQNRRRALAALAAACIATGAGEAVAQAWPAKPITIVVSYPAGGDTDAIARAYAEKLSARLGQQVIIDNRPGASGTIGNSYVAKSAPDGYTLLFTPSTFPIAQHVLKVAPAVAHDVVKDFTPISKSGNIMTRDAKMCGNHDCANAGGASCDAEMAHTTAAGRPKIIYHIAHVDGARRGAEMAQTMPAG